MGLDETGFYIVENKKNKIILRYKFNTSSAFLRLLYRLTPENKKCTNPAEPAIDCSST